MKIIESKRYRSKENSKINSNTDRVRLTIDLSNPEYFKMLSIIKQIERDVNQYEAKQNMMLKDENTL